MSRAIQLSRCRETRGAGADHRDLLIGSRGRGFGNDPALLPAFVDDGVLDTLDGHGWRVDAQHTRSLARRRAYAARELREVIRLVQSLERLAPQAPIDEIVPFRDQVVDGAAR